MHMCLFLCLPELFLIYVLTTSRPAAVIRRQIGSKSRSYKSFFIAANRGAMLPVLSGGEMTVRLFIQCMNSDLSFPLVNPTPLQLEHT